MEAVQIFFALEEGEVMEAVEGCFALEERQEVEAAPSSFAFTTVLMENKAVYIF